MLFSVKTYTSISQLKVISLPYVYYHLTGVSCLCELQIINLILCSYTEKTALTYYYKGCQKNHWMYNINVCGSNQCYYYRLVNNLCLMEFRITICNIAFKHFNKHYLAIVSIMEYYSKYCISQIIGIIVQNG